MLSAGRRLVTSGSGGEDQVAGDRWRVACGRGRMASGILRGRLRVAAVGSGWRVMWASLDFAWMLFRGAAGPARLRANARFGGHAFTWRVC